MMQPLSIRVAKGKMAGGAWQDEPPGLAVAEPPRLALGPDKGILYVLVEVEGSPNRDAVEGELTEIVKEEYFRVSGGITNGLRQAIRAANTCLWETNQEGDNYSGAISCAVLRGDDLYLGQGGPTLACIIQGGEMRTYPEVSWAQEAPVAGPLYAPLGSEEYIGEVGLYYRSMEPGSMVILASPGLAATMSRQEFVRAVSGGGEEALLNVANLAKGRDFSILVLRVTQEEALEAAPTRERRPAQKLEIGERVAPLQERLGAGSQALLRGLKSLVKGMLPGEYAEPQARPAARRRTVDRAARPKGEPVRVPWRLILVVILLAIVGVGIAMGFRQVQAQRAKEAHFAELIASAQEQVSLAQASTEDLAAQGYLARAQELLSEAEGIKPGDAQIESLRAQVQARLDQLANIVRPPLRVAFEMGEGSTPARVAVHDNDVYLLDTGQDSLYRYIWSEASRTLQTPPEGAILIEPGGQGELLDIFWGEPGGERERGALFILRRDGLLEYDPLKGITSVEVADTDTWKTPQRGGAYSGNFYLLDPQANTILKYLPIGRDYSASAMNYLAPGTTVDLSRAVDMAIDGDIYVLTSDGKIIKFTLGELEPYQLETELSNPTSFFTLEGLNYIYVADGGNQRIVQLDKEGRFVRQYLAFSEGAFAQLRATYVDEGKGVLFIVSGSTLYLADLK